MADPRQVGPQARRSHQSELMAALSRASQGEIVNACPFGCGDHELDDRGYCRHLVGFTEDGKVMETLVNVGGQRIVSGAHLQPVHKLDRLVRITTCHRVYRKDPDAAPPTTSSGAAGRTRAESAA